MAIVTGDGVAITALEEVAFGAASVGEDIGAEAYPWPTMRPPTRQGRRRCAQDQ
ncbi:MAG: hypothetical protein U1E90_03230 [Burkholderiaceae bacterium]